MEIPSDDEIRTQILKLIQEVGIVEVGRRALVAQRSNSSLANASIFGRVIHYWALNRGMQNNGRRLSLLALGHSIGVGSER